MFTFLVNHWYFYRHYIAPASNFKIGGTYIYWKSSKYNTVQSDFFAIMLKLKIA